jgi:hypothetical protein
MTIPARLICLFSLAMALAQPCRGIVAVTWLAEPIVLWSDFFDVFTPLDLNSDGIVDFTFVANVYSIGSRAESNNQYLIWPSGGSNVGGDIEPLSEEFEIGPNSGDDSWIDWFGDGEGFDNLITCLSGSGGYTCAGRFVGQRAYMGVSFAIDNQIHYGWIDLLVDSDHPYAEIYGWGYETEVGASILAGAVPEPSTIHLITLGFALFLFPAIKKQFANIRGIAACEATLQSPG